MVFLYPKNQANHQTITPHTTRRRTISIDIIYLFITTKTKQINTQLNIEKLYQKCKLKIQNFSQNNITIRFYIEKSHQNFA